MAKNKRTRSGRKTRGKGENFTGKKENEVETRQASADLKVASGDKIVHHMKSVKGWKDKVTTMQGHLRNAYKAAKADNVSKGTLDDLLGLERGDPAEFRQEMESLSNGLRAVGAPFQVTIFDTMYGSPIEQAKAEARAAAQAGRAPECKYPESSPEYDAYMEVYAQVQSSRVPGADLLSDEERNEAVSAGRASPQSDLEAALH